MIGEFVEIALWTRIHVPHGWVIIGSKGCKAGYCDQCYAMRARKWFVRV